MYYKENNSIFTAPSQPVTMIVQVTEREILDDTQFLTTVKQIKLIKIAKVFRY